MIKNKKMDNMELQIKKGYKDVKNMIEKYPGYENFLDKVIKLEGNIGDYLVQILKGKPYGKKIEEANVYKLYMGGGEGRSGLEKRILNKVVGKEVSINDLLQEGIDSLNKILSIDNSSEKMFEDLKMEILDVEGVILPPDEKEIIMEGGGKKIEKKELKINKIGLLILVLREKGIYTDDLLVYKGKNTNNMMREYSYYGIYVPRANKTVFINEGYGEATYICDGQISLEEMQRLGKEGLVEKYGAVKLSFEEKK